MFRHRRWDSWKEPMIWGIIITIMGLTLSFFSCGVILLRPMAYEGEYTLKYKSSEGMRHTFVSEDGEYVYEKNYIVIQKVPEYLKTDVFVNDAGVQYFDVHLGKTVTQFRILKALFNLLNGTPFFGMSVLFFCISYWMYKMGFGVDSSEEEPPQPPQSSGTRKYYK